MSSKGTDAIKAASAANDLIERQAEEIKILRADKYRRIMRAGTDPSPEQAETNLEDNLNELGILSPKEKGE